MLVYAIRRLILAIPVLLFISIVLFGLLHLAPGDPARILVGSHEVSESVLDAIRAKYHLNASLPEQYLIWLGDVLRGDLGQSFRQQMAVSTLIAVRLPTTLLLVGGAFVLTLLISLPLGVIAAARQNTWVDSSLSLISLIGLSSPVFFTGIVAILAFSFWLGWLPAFGTGTGGLDTVRHLVLPWVVLALSMIALTSRMTRSGMIEALSSDYIEAARARGLPERTILVKHAFRNALIPVITIAGLQLGYLVVGSVLVEFTFGLGGLGSLLVQGVQSLDYPIVQGVTLLLAVAYVLLNLITDLLYGVADPRVRLRGTA